MFLGISSLSFASMNHFHAEESDHTSADIHSNIENDNNTTDNTSNVITESQEHEESTIQENEVPSSDNVNQSSFVNEKKDNRKITVNVQVVAPKIPTEQIIELREYHAKQGAIWLNRKIEALDKTIENERNRLKQHYENRLSDIEKQKKLISILHNEELKATAEVLAARGDNHLKAMDRITIIELDKVKNIIESKTPYYQLKYYSWVNELLQIHDRNLNEECRKVDEFEVHVDKLENLVDGFVDNEKIRKAKTLSSLGLYKLQENINDSKPFYNELIMLKENNSDNNDITRIIDTFPKEIAMKGVSNLIELQTSFKFLKRTSSLSDSSDKVEELLESGNVSRALYHIKRMKTKTEEMQNWINDAEEHLQAEKTINSLRTQYNQKE